MNIMLHVEATHIPEEPARYTCHICGLVRHGGALTTQLYV
jgi:hypothetical protein